jgi:hypothetical protein
MTPSSHKSKVFSSQILVRCFPDTNLRSTLRDSLLLSLASRSKLFINRLPHRVRRLSGRYKYPLPLPCPSPPPTQFENPHQIMPNSFISPLTKYIPVPHLQLTSFIPRSSFQRVRLLRRMIPQAPTFPTKTRGAPTYSTTSDSFSTSWSNGE